MGLRRAVRQPPQPVQVPVVPPPREPVLLFDAAYEHAQAVGYAIEDELPSWSAGYPDLDFVIVFAECFGGTCEYEGYVCRAGNVTTRASGQDGVGLAC
jgi:hypothetical protein